MRRFPLYLIAVFAAVVVGVFLRPTALEPGNALPEVRVAGWTNGNVPDHQGKVTVLEVFATW